MTSPNAWTPDSWRKFPYAQDVAYDDPAELDRVFTRLRSLPPLVTSWEIERLRTLLGDAQEGKRFLLQGGDCAETFADCNNEIIANKLKILLQMSLVLVQGGKIPVIRVGRFAGQYAKPRSRPTEVRDGVELPSYFGDLINRPAFTAKARRADPTLLLDGYAHAAYTLNFIRSLTAGGFADLHHPEYWDLSFVQRAGLPPHLREQYTKASRQLSEALRFMEALGESRIDDITRVDFYTSHEGLNLNYESAQTTSVPRRTGHYDLTTHLPWIGERTRALGGAHVEFFRGVNNAVGVKVGPKADPAEIVELVKRLDPDHERGKIVLITRMGASAVTEALPRLIEAIVKSERRVLWTCDPMHGNALTLPNGIKTRDFDAILQELESSFELHARMGTRLGGVHFELTGEDVTECIGGGIEASDLDRRYETMCDPRLNYRQALEMAFRLAEKMRDSLSRT